MESDRKPEPTEFQRRAQSFLYHAVAGTVQMVGGFVNSLPAGVVLGMCGAALMALYAHMYFELPWILWRHLVVDTLAFLVVPLLMAVLCSTVGDIKKYLDHVDPDMELHVWHGRKYYDYVMATRLRRAAVCYDFRKEDQSEVETKDVAQGTS